MENKEERFEITELFMYKAGKKDWKRRFMGTIRRMVDANGKHFVCGQVEVNGCVLHAQAENEELLGEKLDEMVLMILDFGLHSTAGKISGIDRKQFFLN